MLSKVTLLCNARPHQLYWGEREMGTAISCTECSEVAGLIQKFEGASLCAAAFSHSKCSDHLASC